MSVLAKPDKIYLDNPNLLFELGIATTNLEKGGDC